MKKIHRRDFLKSSAILSGGIITGPQLFNPVDILPKRRLQIEKVFSTFEREPLIHSYGFKGGYITRLWQIVSKLEGNGQSGIGLGVQSPLWSDSRVAGKWAEGGSNSLMYNLTTKAIQLIEGKSYASPIEMVDDILDEVYEYGVKITENKDLRKTFALNALVSVDNAAWVLYSRQNNLSSFDKMLPKEYSPALSYQHKKVASIPSISYSTSENEIKSLVEDGYFFIKVKIGYPGDQKEMVEKDMERMTLIHSLIGDARTNNTKDGKIRYYLDANGRYESKEALLKLLDHCEKIGAKDQVAIVEEPINEDLDIDVSDIDYRIAADESAHTYEDALKKIEMGYTAIALKPIAKTLSMTLKIAQLAYEKEIPCLCADLTVNPVLVDWNKSVAARLHPLPGVDVGLLETNGHQNYRNWSTMQGYHPKGDESWTHVNNGVFEITEGFYNKSGGILKDSKHYTSLFK